MDKKPCKIIKFMKMNNIRLQDIIDFFNEHPENAPKDYKYHTRLSCKQVELLEDALIINQVPFTIGNIVFFDSYYQINVFSNGKNGKFIKPLIINDKNSRKVFNLVKLYFRNKLPSGIAIMFSPNKVVDINPKIDLDYFVRTLQKNTSENGKWADFVDFEKKRTLSEFYSESQGKVEYAVSLKNIYIDYLVGMQSPQKLIRAYEFIDFEREDCFIFSISLGYERTAIVFENVNYARASYVFVCENDSYEDAINKVFSFFSDENITNKRYSLHLKSIKPLLFNSIQYYVVLHNSFKNWVKHLKKVLEVDIEDKLHIQFQPGLKTASPCVSRQIQEQKINPKNKHEQIKKVLFDQLVFKYGCDCVGSELFIGNNRIDVAVKKGTEFDIFEIKTCATSRACVREAMGQILEYAYLDSKETISRMYIVSYCYPEPDVEEYLERIRNQHKIPVFYLMQELHMVNVK